MSKVTIVGQGYVGLPLAIEAATAGHEVVGLDIDESKILDLQRGITKIPDSRISDRCRRCVVIFYNLASH